jgi:hypothetical protein
MEDVDVERSLAFFADHGGFCSCDVLYTVDCCETD